MGRERHPPHLFLPGADRAALNVGAKEVLHLPSGPYEFMHASREMVGPYMARAIFSPMGDFTSQLQAVDIARAAMVELFKPENRAETDRSADIRARREAELAPPPTPDATPSRRKLLTGGLGG